MHRLWALLTSVTALHALDEDAQGAAITHRRLLLVIYPAITVALLLFLTLVVLALRSARPEPRTTGRSSIKEHPLLQRAGVSDALVELHPETSFAEDFSQAVTWRRMLVFTGAILFSLGLAVLNDHRLFASQHTVHVATSAACQAACRATVHCDVDSLTFRTVFCTAAAAECSEEAVGSRSVEFAECSFLVVTEAWKVDLILVSAIFGVFLVVEGAPAELILFGLSCLYGVLGIISSGQVWAGLGSSSVVGLALLFPIAAAVEETGVLDTGIGMMLGIPESFLVAFFRMLAPVALLSAFLSNTAIVTMMIPVVVSWSRTLGVHPGKLLMPLSFAAQLGGSCTLIGSSHVLVARDSLDKSLYDMGFFDLTYCGTLLSLATFGAMALCLPFLAPAVTLEAQEQPCRQSLYEVTFSLRAKSSYVATAFEVTAAQLKRLPGVKEIVKREGYTLKEEEELLFRVTEIGVRSLRRMPQLRIANEDALRALGMERERRHLYEANLAPRLLCDQAFDLDVVRQALGACPIAIRGKESGAVPRAGDILLLEADERYVESKLWQEEFAITKMVPESSPQRSGGVHDKFRCVLVCLGMVTLIGSVTLDVVDLSTGAGVFVLLLVLSNAYSMTSVYRSIRAPVLLTIAGATGLSMALQSTGIARFAAQQLTALALPYGQLGLRVAVYVMSSSLTLFMNNSATVAILGPMLATMAKSSCGSDLVCQQRCTRGLAQVMVFAAGTCLMSPLGYQTNLMVMKDGGYSFADFAKYGGIIQAFHLVCCVAVVTFMVDVLDL